MVQLAGGRSARQIVSSRRLYFEIADGLGLAVRNDRAAGHLLGDGLRRENHRARLLQFFNQGRNHVIAMEIGDQNVVRSRHPFIAALRRIDIHDLASRLDHEAGMLNGRNLERAGGRGKLFRRSAPRGAHCKQ